MSRVRYSLSLLLTLLSATVLQAASQESYIGTSLLRFNYVEYDDNGKWLDEENGLIPGLVLSSVQRHPGYWTRWDASIGYDLIYYNGQTQSGTPLQTRSDALLIDMAIMYGQDFAPAYGREMGVYAGLGYRYWLRNIRPGVDANGNNVAGILEHYRWYYGILGYKAMFWAGDRVKTGWDFRFTRMLAAEMGIDFLGYCGYDNTRVSLGEKPGARLAVPVEIRRRHGTLTITPYYEIIDIGRSNTVFLTRNGSLVDCDGNGFNDAVYEPRSETRNFGIEFSWQW